MARMGLSLWLVAACLVMGCGDDDDDELSRAEARDEATLVTCDYVERCDGIGEGEDYATREECEIETRAFLENAWPLSDCEDIDEDAYNACVLELDIAECGNGLDFLSALDKCSRENICSQEE